MYNKELDTYVPLFVTDFSKKPYRSFFYINDKISLSLDEMVEIGKEWLNDKNFDAGFCEYLEKMR